MMAGTAAVVICYLILGWTKEIVGFFVTDPELVRFQSVRPSSDGLKTEGIG